MEQDLELKSNKKRIDGIKLSVIGVVLLGVAIFIVLQNIMHMMNTPAEQAILIEQSSSMLPMYTVFGIIFLMGITLLVLGFKKITNITN